MTPFQGFFFFVSTIPGAVPRAGMFQPFRLVGPRTRPRHIRTERTGKRRAGWPPLKGERGITPLLRGDVLIRLGLRDGSRESSPAEPP